MTSAAAVDSATSPPSSSRTAVDDSSSSSYGSWHHLKWGVPLALLMQYAGALKWGVLVALIVGLLRRHMARTRAELFGGRPASFWSSSTEPPHDAPGLSLWLVGPTHLLYSLLSVRAMSSMRDSGIFRSIVDSATIVGGALVYGWRPWFVRRFFLACEGRLYDLKYGPEPRHTADVMWTHRVQMDSVAPSDKEAAPIAVADADAALMSSLSPVVVFMHGGAWCSGSKEVYRLFLQHLEESLGLVVVAINYRVYPDGNVATQVSDLDLAVEWVSQHATEWGGDPSRIILMGHSSGAHCASLYLVWQLARCGSLRVPIHGFIGLSGPYDIADHFEFESARGIHLGSPTLAANGFEGGLEAHSTTRVALALTPEQRAKMPPVLLLHGAADTIIPYSSSVRLAYALSGGGFANKDAIAIDQLASHDAYHAPVSVGDVLRSLTFPPPAPLIQLRICGFATDPALCDHGSYIFDVMHSCARTGPGGSPQSIPIGHSRWLTESITAFLQAAAERRPAPANKTPEPTSVDTTPPPTDITSNM